MPIVMSVLKRGLVLSGAPASPWAPTRTSTTQMLGVATIAVLSLAVSACGGNAHTTSSAAPGPVIVITDKTCGLGWQHPKAGLQTLQIRNSASAVLEISLIAAEDGGVYAKLEGVGPGTTRAMPVDVGSGLYAFECDGNNYGDQVGPSVRVPGDVRGGTAILPVSTAQMITATQQVEAYVASGLTTLERQTATLAAEIGSGNLGSARATWLTAHLTFERLGSAYGMFGDYDDEINGTPFGVPGGVSSKNFTGFYRLEYGLWHGQSASQLTGPANELAVDVRSLSAAWPGMVMQPPFQLSDLALRTHEVLENAMQFQLSGQDNFGSNTNMATMAAAIDATRAQLAILQPLLVTRYQDLVALDTWLNRLQQLVDTTETSSGWTPVSALSSTQQAELDSAAGQTVELLAGIPPLFEAKPMP
jgi:iron uptake system component EfeO